MQWRLMVVLLLVLSGCSVGKNSMAGQRVEFVTDDGVLLVGTLVHVPKSNTAILLLHQLNHDRSTYAPLVPLLNQQGISTLALDLRGHGESGLDWTTFTDEDFLGMVHDVEASLKFLHENKFELGGIVGASIGANIALIAGKELGIPNIVMLSPGMDYRGVNIEKDAKRYQGRALVLATEGDEYSAQSSRDVGKLMGSKGVIRVLGGDSHGTYLFEEHPELLDTIVSFLRQ